jgi:hypothetical protein
MGLRDATLGLGTVAEKGQSNFVEAVTGTVPRAPDCVGGGLGEPSPAPHPKLLGPAFQTGGAFFLHRAARSHHAPAASMEDWKKSELEIF